MKKIISLTAVALFLAASISAQQRKDVVYLDNGSVIKGEIIEQIPNETIKIKTKDGNIFVYKTSEISRIVREDSSTYPREGRHKGLDFSINIGYNIGVGDNKNAKSLPIELGLGKQINKNLYLGGSTGVWVGTSKGAKPLIPFAVDSKILFPLSSSEIEPLLNFRLGYLFNTGKTPGGSFIDPTSGSTRELKSERLPGEIMMQIMPGIQIPLSGGVDFMLAAGYTHNFVTEGGLSGGYFAVKTGISLHKNPNKAPRKRRLPVPTRNRGFHWTLEGGANFTDGPGGGGDMVFGYKINPHFSVGAGFGYEIMSPFANEESAQVISLSGNGVSEYYLNDIYSSLSQARIYLRGVYRMLDRKFSPIVACDAGIRLYSLSEDYYTILGNVPATDLFSHPDKSGLFLSPAIGVSLRTTNNSYIELKGGYSLAQNILGEKISTEINGTPVYGSSKSVKVCAPFFTIGFSHTFGKRGEKR